MLLLLSADICSDTLFLIRLSLCSTISLARLDADSGVERLRSSSTRVL